MLVVFGQTQCNVANQSRFHLLEGGALFKAKHLREAGHRGTTIMYSRGRPIIGLVDYRRRY